MEEKGTKEVENIGWNQRLGGPDFEPDLGVWVYLCQVKKQMTIFTGRILHLFRGPDLQKNMVCSENGGCSFGGI